VDGAMVPVPIRCRIPEHLKRLGKTQQWLADKAGISKQQLSDYIHMRRNIVLGLAKAKLIATLLNLSKIDLLYDWVWREE
jgi:transcriptional regulator with XRE-family HTH domain